MTLFSSVGLNRRELVSLTIGGIITATTLSWRNAIGRSIDHTQELQLIIDRGGAEVVLPAGEFLISRPLYLNRTIILRGSQSGTHVTQIGFPTPGLIVTADGCRVENLHFSRSARPVVSNWGSFHGLHGSSQDSAIFVLGASDCKILDIDIKGFARGITLAGGRRASIAGFLSAGGTIQIDDVTMRGLCMRCGDRIVARLRGESGWTRAILNTKGELQIERTLQTKGEALIDLIIGRSANNSAEACRIHGAEFGISFQMQDALYLQDLTFTDTTQVNFGLDGRIRAPAHAIYGADGEDIDGLRSGNIVIKHVRASRDDCGTTAFKVRGADRVTVEDASCDSFGGIFSFADISRLDVRRYEARHCRSNIPDRALRGISIQDVDIARISNGEMHLTGLSMPSNQENVLFGIRNADNGRRPADIEVSGLKASVSANFPSTVRLDIVRISGEAFKHLDAKVNLDDLYLFAAESVRGMVGLRAADASNVAVTNSTIEGFDVPVVLGASLGHFSELNVTYNHDNIVDRRRK